VMFPLSPSEIALSVVNHISAMVAYWDRNQICVFSNDAYREWFGKSPEQMVGMSIRELLGPLYEKNLPYVLAALSGEKQVFERQIVLPTGEIRETITTYTPDIANGVVRGFSVHVADVTILREREMALKRAIEERDAALAEVRTLRGLISICSGCKRIRDAQGEWHPIEEYVSAHTDARFSHCFCRACLAKLYPDIEVPENLA